MAELDDFKPHDLRRSFITDAIGASVPLTTVADLVGHATIAMTARYAKAADGQVREAAEQLAASRRAKPRRRSYRTRIWEEAGMTELERVANLAAVSEALDADTERLENRPDNPTQFVRSFFTDENPYMAMTKPCECKRADFDKHAHRDFILRRAFHMLDLGYGLSALKASEPIAAVSAEFRNGSMLEADTLRQIYVRRDRSAWNARASNLEDRAITLGVLAAMAPFDDDYRVLPLSERQELVKKRAVF